MRQVKTFFIEKKNRKYFAAKLKDYNVKILIDENSENLEVGKEYELFVNDISKRSKYGTELIYRLDGESKPENIGNPVIIECEYNLEFVKKARLLGGKWDSDNKVWFFSGLVEKEAEELDYVYASKLIPIQIKAKQDISAYNRPVYFCGKCLAWATGRDSGAELADGIMLISGVVTSGGSMKNWTTAIREDAELRLLIPENVLKLHGSEECVQDNWEITLL